MFARTLAFAAAAASVASATTLVERTGEHPISIHQWQDSWLDCKKQSQTGLINVGFQTCLESDIEGVLVLLNHPGAIKSDQWQKAWLKCGKQDQTGLINIGLQTCIISEIEGFLSILNIVPVPLERSLEERTKDVITPKQWQDAWLDCGKQDQTGLVNVGLQTCIISQIEGILVALNHPGAIKSDQWQKAWLKCGKQDQTGLINVGVQTCIVSEVEGFLSILNIVPSLPVHTRSLSWLPPVPLGLDAKQWQKTWAKCGVQHQTGLVNVAVTTCVIAELEGLVAAPALKRRTGEGLPCPKGLKLKQWQKIWADCGHQSQVGLINVAVATCVVAAVEGALHLL